MNSAIIQLIVLAGIAVFLILKLRSVLGTRQGFEKPAKPVVIDNDTAPRAKRGFEVIEGGADADITDNVAKDSPAAQALAAMKRAEPAFNVTDFLRGARGAYEMILTAFDKGELDKVLPFLSREVYDSFVQVVEDREARGLTVKSTFVGIREMNLTKAEFNPATAEAEVTVRFIGEITSSTRDKAGQVVDGDPNEIKRQKDIWTFARKMGVDNPNWQLVATGE
jgi:predicted lipid-binding transport protein (Tim44 family)